MRTLISFITLYVLLVVLFEVSAEQVPDPALRNASQGTFADYLKIRDALQDELFAAPDSFDLNWRITLAFYSLGTTAESEDSRIDFFHQCAEQAKRMTISFPRKAEGYYLNALCLGKKGQLEGLLTGLFVVSQLKRNMETAIRLDPTIESGGPHRALGRLYNDLPRLFGGNMESSIRHLKQAVEIAPDFSDNHLFLAEAFYNNHQMKAAERSLISFFKTDPSEKDAKLGQKLLRSIRLKLNTAHAQGTNDK
tara:strand:+ start:2395 stop:3147 length:753 start_codon:yes stop_codon:yes gene_type:complete